LGAIIAMRGYIDTREKERQDRLATALNDTLTLLVSEQWRQRVVGAAGLLSFFTADRADFHRQALSALVAAARIKEEQLVVQQGIRLAVEQAVRSVVREVLVDVSWRGVVLPGVNLSRADLRNFDLRDSDLQNAELSGTQLMGADLSAAQLQGAHLDAARLSSANLSYADLAGANLAGADLGRATLTGIKVLNLELEGCELRDIGAGWRGVPWDATLNWRQAQFDPPIRAELDRIYGPAVPAIRILMLMWEIPPLVAGGTWTACYHLIRNLRRRGADVTIVVPWKRSALVSDPPPFGIEVPLVTLDIEVPEEAVADGTWSPYSSPSVPAAYAGPGGYSGWSPYGGGGRLWSEVSGSRNPLPGPYGASAAMRAVGPYSAPYGGPYGGPYGAPYAGPYLSSTVGIYGWGSSGYRGGPLLGSVLFRLIGEFRGKLRNYVEDNRFDILHAHDWVTFDAARAAAEHIGVPWVAHFHSTEAERQPDAPDPLTQRIEQGAVDSAQRVVAVSEVTRRVIRQSYDTGARRSIDVVPNSLSEGTAPTNEMGRFESHRVVFLGRLARQKGVDLFCEIASRVRQSGFRADFVAFGDGPERYLLLREGISSPGPLGWDQRGTAFRGASALVVPSRFEPFGMVILEAMQHRVPVIYPKDSGAGEVLESGIKIASENTAAAAEAFMHLLGDLSAWEGAVVESAREIEQYPRRDYADRLIAVWTEARSSYASAHAPGPD
jgi:glycosyltransferase involved in cell wall biosynthesis